MLREKYQIIQNKESVEFAMSMSLSYLRYNFLKN